MAAISGGGAAGPLAAGGGGLLQTAEEEKQRTTTTATELAGEGSTSALPLPLPAAAAATILAPPLLLLCPPYPKSGKRKAVHSWDLERRRISKLAKSDPRRNLSTVVKPADPCDADSAAESSGVENPRDKELVLRAACSVVSVCSTALDGELITQCSGIVVGWNVTSKCARILTTSRIIRERDPEPKLHVRLPNRTVIEGKLLLVNEHYQIALLEISSESDLPLQVPTFGSSPKYGQEVFVLARGEESNLRVRHGRIKWSEEPEKLDRNYLMLLSCDTPKHGTGGLVVDHDGHVVGMSFSKGVPNCAILGISTILTCIEMWMKFSRIARPVHGLSLRTMELLEVSIQETIFLEHNITSGYIVNDVEYDCTAERLGVRYGDVIVSFNGQRGHTLPQLEDYLLSLGWGFLHRSIESSSTVDLKLEVYDPLGRTTRSITMPLKFSDGSD